MREGFHHVRLSPESGLPHPAPTKSVRPHKQNTGPRRNLCIHLIHWPPFAGECMEAWEGKAFPPRLHLVTRIYVHICPFQEGWQEGATREAVWGMECLQACLVSKSRNQTPITSLTHCSAFFRSRELCLHLPTDLKKWDKGLHKMTYRKVLHFLASLAPLLLCVPFVRDPVPFHWGTEKMPIHHGHDSCTVFPPPPAQVSQQRSCTHMHALTCTHVCAHIHTCMHTCINTHLQTHAHTFTCTHTFVHMHTCIDTHTCLYTSTHTQHWLHPCRREPCNMLTSTAGDPMRGTLFTSRSGLGSLQPPATLHLPCWCLQARGGYNSRHCIRDTSCLALINFFVSLEKTYLVV